MHKEIEVLWPGINFPRIKSVLVGCCYSPPSSNHNYLEAIDEMLDKVCELNMEVMLTGDLNIIFLQQHLMLLTTGCYGFR